MSLIVDVILICCDFWHWIEDILKHSDIGVGLQSHPILLPACFHGRPPAALLLSETILPLSYSIPSLPFTQGHYLSSSFLPFSLSISSFPLHQSHHHIKILLYLPFKKKTKQNKTLKQTLSWLYFLSSCHPIYLLFFKAKPFSRVVSTVWVQTLLSSLLKHT